MAKSTGKRMCTMYLPLTSSNHIIMEKKGKWSELTDEKKLLCIV